MKKEQTLWATVLYGKNGEVLQLDVESICYAKKTAKELLMKSYNTGTEAKYTWKDFQKWGRKCVKIKIQIP